MKFHSDLFGWEYVWRNFAEEKAGTVVTDTGEEEGKLKYLSIPVTDSNSNSGLEAIKGATPQVFFAPEMHHGKKAPGCIAAIFYPSNDNFAFSIFQEKIHHQLGKALGMQDFQVHDSLFDGKFMIQGTNEQTIQELFESQALRELILLYPPTILHIDTKAAKTFKEFGLPVDHHAIVYKHDDVMDKLHQMQAAFDIVVSILQSVGNSGVIGGGSSHGKPRATEVSENQDTGGRKLHSPLLDR